MGSFSKKAPVVARQVMPFTARPSSPLTFSAMKEVLVIEPMVILQHQSVLSRSLSDDELLHVYNEEFFIEAQVTAEDDFADQISQECDAIVARRHPDRIVAAGLVFSVQVPFVTYEALATPAPVYNARCVKTATADVLFNSSTQEDTAKELALRSVFNPSEYPALFMRPAKPIFPHTLSPVLPGTSDTFLPGLDHLTSIESRSAFITYNKHVQAQEASSAHATAAPVLESIPHDCRTGACSCLVYKGDITESVSSSAAAQSMLDVIDDLVDDDSVVKSEVADASSVFFPTEDDAFSANQVLPSFSGFSEFHNSAVADDSDSSDESIEYPSATKLLPLHCLDADTQVFIGFSAFSQFLEDVDDAEVAPRIHRSEDDFDYEDIDLVDGVVEIGDSPISQHDEPSAALPSAEATMLSTLIEDIQAHACESRSSLEMGLRRISRNYGWTKYLLLTPLSTLMEESSEQDQPVFVQPLPTRRANFLDDEDSDPSAEEDAPLKLFSIRRVG